MKNNTFLWLLGLLIFASCEEEFLPDTQFQSKIVVEGFIEVGDNALPPYVLLTRTFPFYNDINNGVLDSLFVRNARVTITEEDGTETQLSELCLQDLSPALREQIAKLLGIEGSTGNIDNLNLCAYIAGDEVKPVIGKSYLLTVDVNEEHLTARTTIPPHVSIDSIWFTETPGKAKDTLAEMNCRARDPLGPDYYRYMTAENNGPLIAPFSSVTDDVFFEGQEFFFPLSKAEDPNDPDIDFETFGFWRVGDTATLKWMNIDRDHFDFWTTFEASRNNQGPFSTYTRVSYNVEGGLGIWGGISSSTYTEIVKK